MQRKNHAKKTALPDGSRLRFGIVVPEFHKDITKRLLDGALATLEKCKVKRKNIDILRVPGSFEIPFGCLLFLNPDAPTLRRGSGLRPKRRRKKYGALIALGCIIKGETSHDVYIASAVSQGIMNLSLEYGTPISFGVITTNNLAQARARSRGEANRGKDAALAAVAMALFMS